MVITATKQMDGTFELTTSAGSVWGTKGNSRTADWYPKAHRAVQPRHLSEEDVNKLFGPKGTFKAGARITWVGK